ncbi:MAG: Lrp/AsnC family transcriptional regulator [Thermoproteales archaeon]|nr:Lrp/AsnC family transcriptional regulator [Thermoproteales archaeon]
MDEVDRKIIRILRENSRTPFKEIAKRLNMTEGAVRYRVKSLINKGVIKRFTIELGSNGGVSSLIYVKTSEKADLKALCSRILKNDDVEKIYEVTGEYDLVVLVRTSSIHNLNNIIDKIRAEEGVVTTISSLILQEYNQ